MSEPALSVKTKKPQYFCGKKWALIDSWGFLKEKKNLPDFLQQGPAGSQNIKLFFQKKNYFHVIVNIVSLYCNILVDLAHEMSTLNFLV